MFLPLREQVAVSTHNEQPNQRVNKLMKKNLWVVFCKKDKTLHTCLLNTWMTEQEGVLEVNIMFSMLITI